MDLILLAAGKSTRIYKKIKINKCLININKKSLIRNIIDNAKLSSIKKISIVTGFKPKNIINDLKNYKKINFIHNAKYKTTDMVNSAMLALRKSKGDVVISYTDIFYEKIIFDDLKKIKTNSITLPYLTNWKSVWKIRKKNIFDDAETFNIDSKNSLNEIGSKINKKNLKKVNGQFMGIVFIPKKLIKDIIYIYDSINNKKLQFTEFLNILIKQEMKIKVLKYSKFWYEIDDFVDYKNFIKFYKKN
tara:strand:- start:142 stop:879 length:738 start_codon:yes stop_codon:yes gene_type:complete